MALTEKFWAEEIAIAALFIVLNASRNALWLKLHLLFPVMIAACPTSGTNNRLFRDVVQSQQIRDCPGDSGTVGAYAITNWWVHVYLF